ncbi:MAG: S8 family serine peptidase [bacterium]|nr:S8 family serine peptidase [bacterium]
MKRNKLGICALTIGALGFLACLTNGENSSISNNPLLNRNATFLVSLEGTEKSLGNDGVKAVQEEFLNDLRSKVGFNFRVVDTYDAINAIKIQANETLENVIKEAAHVRKASINTSYRFSETYSGMRNEEEIEEGFIPYVNNTEGTSEASSIADNQSATSMNVPLSSNGGAGSFVAILDSGFYIEHNAFAPLTGEAAQKAKDRFSYKDLQVSYDKLVAQKKNALGEEANNISYKGTLNDGSLYYNLKIPFYYDYGGSSESSSNDYDVLSHVSEHGNHVASITGANGTYTGIAPNAQLALMKVFYEVIPTDDSSVGGVYAKDEDILEALNDCAVLGVDALNMSLGSDLDDFSDKATSMDVIDKLEGDGCSANISAGNAGKSLFSSMGIYKNWSTDLTDTGILGSYANSKTANIIASSTNPKQYYEKALKIGSNIVGYSDQVDYSNGSDGITKEKEQLLSKLITDANGNVDTEKELEIVTAGKADSTGNYYGDSASYSAVTANDPNYFKGKIAICDRGNISFIDKAKAASEAGCSALIVINNDPTAIEFSFGMSWSAGDGLYDIPTIPVVFVLYRDRQAILSSLEKSTINDADCGFKGKTKLAEKTEEDNPDKDKLSDFSSDGAASDLSLNPTISAPGSSIKGATLGKANAQGYVDELDPNYFEYLSGTSMAAPNYTGAVALLIGEQEFASEEERIAYLKTITMRTMSTASQYQTVNTKYGAITESKAVTTDEYKKEVTIYTPVESDVKNDVAPYSPRKQGAGVVNVGKAISSSVYLEGAVVSENGSFNTETGNRFAKVELKNNNLIKNGTIKIANFIHNPKGKTTKYKVTMSVMAPQLSAYHNHDNELPNYVTEDAKYEGAMIQTAFDEVLEKDVEIGEVTLTGEAKQFVEFKPYTVSQKTKDYLANFQNGTYIEGFVKYTPVGEAESEENPSLTMPYLGFYGDYSKADAVEPFSFEKDTIYDRVNGTKDENGNTVGRLYGSDLVNYVGSHSYSLRSIDVGSGISMDSFDNYQKNDRRTAVLKNDNNLYSFGKEIVNKKNEDGSYTLYIGGNTTDILYIQQFIYRSINSADVKILDSKNNALITKNITNMYTNTSALFKSHINANLIGSKVLSYRGYCELPLYKDDGTKIPNGEYTLKFTYHLVYGSTQTKSYKIVIDATAPVLSSRSIFDNNGTKTLRLKFTEIYIPSETKVHVNADLSTFTMTKVSDGYIIDIPLDGAFVDGKCFINVSDATYNYTYITVNEADLYTGVVIESGALTPGSTYSYEVVQNGGKTNINETYTIHALDYKGNTLNLGNYTAYVSFDRKITGALKVYELRGDQKVECKNYSLLDSTTVRIKTNATSFIIEDSSKKQDSILSEDNATVTLNEVANGKVYCDKLAGRSGESATIYAIADSGYKVESVKVNGKEISVDAYGNYTFTLAAGANVVEVTFVAI